MKKNHIQRDNWLYGHASWWLISMGRIVLFITMCCFPVCGATQTANIHELQAVFLFNFASFVQWPKTAFSGPTTPITYCTIDNHRAYNHLRAVLKGEMVKGRKLMVIEVNDKRELSNCHVLFIGASVEKQSHSILQSVAGKSILTVGESPEFLSNGGLIYLHRKKNRIQIELNMENVKNSGLKISSKLLRLAKIK